MLPRETMASFMVSSRVRIAAAAALASPQTPTLICFTSPSMRWSLSTWMILAFFGQ